MDKEHKNKKVVDRLAGNLKKYAWQELRSMLEEYIVRCRRDMLFQEKEHDEEVCIRFPGTWKDLEVVPADYEVRTPGFFFAFNVSGVYEQLQRRDEYVYRYRTRGRIPHRVFLEMAEEGVHVLYEDAHDGEGDSPYTLVALTGPFRHDLLEFKYADPCPEKVLGTGRFEMPLNVAFGLEVGGYRFQKMYFSDPEGTREDCLRDAYNRPVCQARLGPVFRRTLQGSGAGTGVTFTAPLFSSHGELLPHAREQGAAPGAEALKIGVGDIDVLEAALAPGEGCPDLEDLLEAGMYEIELNRGLLAGRLDRALREGMFCLEDMDGDLPGAGGGPEGGAGTPEERAAGILSDFVAFHYGAAQARAPWGPHSLHPELRRAHYNLLVCADELDRALEFVDVLVENLQPDARWKRYSEYELDDIRKLRELIDEFKYNDLIVIHSCMEKPALSVDELGSGHVHDAVRKKIEDHDTRWGVISECARQEGAAGLILVADSTVYRTTLRCDAEIHDVVCSAHLRLKELTPGQVFQLFMKELEGSSFGKMMDDGFRAKAEEYVRTVYPKSGLRAAHFIQAHLGKFYANLTIKGWDSRSLADCIPAYRMPSVDRILAELKGKTGLGKVAERFEAIYAMRDVLLRAGEPYHMSFEGPPGCGKTMVARMMAEMLFHMGVTRRPKLVEMQAGDFRSIWMGGTSMKVRGRIREAYGGVLFIDEAYILAEDKFQEGLSILLTEMSDRDNPERPVVILAGYEDRMRGLLKANEGLDSRIKYHVKFRDYTRAELKDILKGKLGELGFTVEGTQEAEGLLEDLVLEKMSHEFFGNARDMEKLCFELIGAWGEMDAGAGAGPACGMPSISAAHMRRLLPETDTREVRMILRDQPALKEELEKFRSGVAYKRALRKGTGGRGIPAACLHMVFAGDPGTGKSTVARKLADYLCEMHVIPTNKCITVEAKDLLSRSGNMPPAGHTEDCLRRARGGILFVDEAYSLAREPGGDEVIHVLLTAMEEYKEDTVFVFAGYPREMEELLGRNPGLRSRIGYTFRFEPYTEEALARMFTDKMAGMGLAFEDAAGAVKGLEDIMRYFRCMQGFGNGRFVVNLLDAMMNKHGMRLAGEYPEGLEGCPPDAVTTYTREDLPTKKEILKSFWGIDMAPEEYEEKEKETTAVHELGHATVAMAAGLGHGPGVERVTVRPVYGAAGYVEYDVSKLRTEQDYRIRVASALGGRNAEKLYFGSHTHGCRRDFEYAKWTAERMVEDFAMGDLGVTSSMDILREADAYATRLLHENRGFIDRMKPFLLEYGEIGGEDLRRAYRAFREGAYRDPAAGEGLDAVLVDLRRKYGGEA